MHNSRRWKTYEMGLVGNGGGGSGFKDGFQVDSAVWFSGRGGFSRKRIARLRSRTEILLSVGCSNGEEWYRTSGLRTAFLQTFFPISARICYIFHCVKPASCRGSKNPRLSMPTLAKQWLLVKTSRLSLDRTYNESLPTTRLESYAYRRDDYCTVAI